MNTLCIKCFVYLYWHFVFNWMKHNKISIRWLEETFLDQFPPIIASETAWYVAASLCKILSWILDKSSAENNIMFDWRCIYKLILLNKYFFIFFHWEVSFNAYTYHLKAHTVYFWIWLRHHHLYFLVMNLSDYLFSFFEKGVWL